MAIAFGHKSTTADCAIGQQPDLQRLSVSKVVAVIQSCKGISQKEIIAATGLSERSVKYALKALKLRRSVSESSMINDMRRKLYRTEG